MMAELQPAVWEALLRDALTVLAFPMDEQVRVNGPGCVTCDMFEQFDHARICAMENEGSLSEDQRIALERIDRTLRSMGETDRECFNVEVLRRPSWQQIREIATVTVRLFGWEGGVVEPFVEVKPGVWQRKSGESQFSITHVTGDGT